MRSRTRLVVELLELRDCPGSLLNLEVPSEPGWTDPAEKRYEPITEPGSEVIDPTHVKYAALDTAVLVKQLTDEEWAEVQAFVAVADAGNDYLYADGFELVEPAEAEAQGKAPVDEQLLARAAAYYHARSAEITQLIGQSAEEQARLQALISGGASYGAIADQTRVVRFAAERVARAGLDQGALGWALSGATAAESAQRVRTVSALAHGAFRQLQEQVRSAGQQLDAMRPATAAERAAWSQAADDYLQLRGRALEAYRFAAGLGLALASTGP